MLVIVISTLFLIAGTHSTTNFKIYKQAKDFFNPANAQSLSKESLEEKRHKRHPFTGMCSLFTWCNMQTWTLCH